MVLTTCIYTCFFYRAYSLHNVHKRVLIHLYDIYIYFYLYIYTYICLCIYRTSTEYLVALDTTAKLLQWCWLLWSILHSATQETAVKMLAMLVLFMQQEALFYLMLSFYT